MKLLILHGPNINLTGKRERGHYGAESFESVNAAIAQYARSLGVECEIFQSNYEGALIDRIHGADGNFDGIILNAGAFTHYSYALRDAISAVGAPCVEVHFSNIQAREEFRAKSVLAPVCRGSVAGFGKYSYFLAIQAFVWGKE